jgi:hypothetical protein
MTPSFFILAESPEVDLNRAERHTLAILDNQIINPAQLANELATL